MSERAAAMSAGDVGIERREHPYAAERGVPDCREALRGHEIVGFEGRLTRLLGWRWLADAVPDAVVRFRSSSFVSRVTNLKAVR